KIPNWLSGSLYSNGSGVYRIGPTAWNHLFDGYPVLQRFTISDGKVSYQQTVLDTDELKKSKEHNRIIGSGFATKFADPNQSSVGSKYTATLPPANRSAVRHIEGQQPPTLAASCQSKCSTSPWRAVNPRYRSLLPIEVQYVVSYYKIP
ncbi:beta,beta-carotene 9',10'-oxygenase, partial [Elysia marginata]